MARIMSQPTYKNSITTTFSIELLAEQISRIDHVFWPR